jgi:penicillin-binding protein 2
MFAFLSPGQFKKRKVSLVSREEIEPHETLLDKLAQKKEEELGISEKKFEVPLLKKVLQLLLIFVFILNSVIFAKTFQFQVIEGKELSALAEENKFIIHQIQAERGVIYDRNSHQLVFNQPSFDLVCRKVDLPKDEVERENVLREVSGIIQKNFEDFKKEIIESRDPLVLVSENLDHQTLIILETKISNLPGFQIENNTIRDYLSGSSFSHLIGYKRKTGEKTGLEKSYDEMLGEKPGEVLTERDAEGNLISKEIIKLPESGKSLVLWLDSELQKKTEEELKKKLKEVGAKVGVAVALDPKTGGVLALVSLPSFDNNLFSKGMSEEEWDQINKDPLKPLFNQVISGGYPTGSAIKPLIASAALEEGIISTQKKINCQGKIEVEHEYDPEIVYTYRDWKTHGWTDMRKAIAESCNVYFYHLGGGYGDQEGLGPTRIKKYLELFGWGAKTGIDLPQEAEGFLPDPGWKKEEIGEIWYDGDTYHLSIGQGYLRVTPLQMAASFVPIANGGKLLQPRVVKEILGYNPDTHQNEVEEVEPEIIREGFINPEYLEVVRQGMRQAVTSGTATGWLDQLKVPAASKTGSAQTGEKGYLDNWITVFAPYEDPQIVLTIMIKDVKEGLVVTPPVAKAILEWYFAQEANF